MYNPNEISDFVLDVETKLIRKGFKENEIERDTIESLFYDGYTINQAVAWIIKNNV